jgi:class 3 adenylate cyclase
LNLSVRGAVNTGEAVVTIGARPDLGEGFVTGDVVNAASRLQGQAPVGGIIVGDLTHAATRDEIEYEALESVHVKGKAEALSVWRAIRARRFLDAADRSRARAGVAAGPLPPGPA